MAVMSLGLYLTEYAPMLLYFGGIVVFFASAFWRPEIGIYYLVPLLPLQTLRYKLHGLPLGAQWIDIMLLGVLVGVWRKGYPVFTKTALGKLLLILAVLTYFSLWVGAFFLNSALPWSFSDPRMSDWKNYMVIFLLFFLVLASIREVKQMKIVVLLICLSMLSINRDYINTMRGRDFSSFSYDIRDAGVMGYAGVNGLAALEAYFSAFLMGLYSMHKKILAKTGYLIMLITCLISLTYTLSRGGYAAALLGAFCVGVMKNRKILILLIVFLFTWQLLVPNAVRERVFMTQDQDGQLDSSAGTRVTLWENALEIFRGNPIIGTGFDTYRFMHAVGPYEDTHNYYMKVIVETGILGLAVFLGILSRMFSAGYRLSQSQSSDGFLQGMGLGLTAMIVAVAVANFFGDRWTYIEETGFTWVILAMAIRGEMILSEEAERAADSAESESSISSVDAAELGTARVTGVGDDRDRWRSAGTLGLCSLVRGLKE